MAVAQGISKQTKIVKQSALGSPGSTGSQLLRRRSSVFQLARDMFQNDEIVTHQQSTGATYGLKKTTGKIDGLLSPGTYQVIFAGALRAAAASTSAYAAGIDVTAAATSPQFVDASGGFLTAGLKVGDVGRWTGFAGGSATANNSKNFLITALTATDMTGVFLNGDAVVADAAGDSVTFTVVGKKIKPPLTAHTNDYFTVEEWYSDLTDSDLFTDLQPTQIAIGLPANGNATFSADFVGLGRSIGGTEICTSPTAETTTGVVTSVDGAVYLNGSNVGNITGLQFTLSTGVQAGQAVMGTNSSPDLQRGRMSVSGQFQALFDATTISALYDAETNVSLICVAAVDDTATSDFVAFTFGRVKLTGDTPDDGEKQIMRTFPFTAEINSAGGTSLAWDQTLMTVQDSDFA